MVCTLLLSQPGGGISPARNKTGPYTHKNGICREKLFFWENVLNIKLNIKIPHLMTIYVHKLNLHDFKNCFLFEVADIVPWRNTKYISIYSTFWYLSTEALFNHTVPFALLKPQAHKWRFSDVLPMMRMDICITTQYIIASTEKKLLCIYCTCSYIVCPYIHVYTQPYSNMHYIHVR